MKAAYRAQAGDALALFARAPIIHMACAGNAGRPILRTVHGVVVDGRIAFHGGDHGDKVAVIGRTVALSAEEIIAEIPSYFIDPERACPATTYYRSAIVHGVMRRVDNLDRKASILQALMERFQPQGGYTPITADDPGYRKTVDSILIAEVEPEDMSAKHKLGQNRNRQQMERVLAGLWRRGLASDLRAIRVIREHHPGKPNPDFLRGPDGSMLCCAPDERDAIQAGQLLATQYWNQGVTADTIARAHLGTSAWIVARQPSDDGPGELIATARAIADGSRYAFIHDVAVVDSWRGRGLGKVIMALLLDHPRLRDCQVTRLKTSDAQGFYASMGFVAQTDPFVEMVLG